MREKMIPVIIDRRTGQIVRFARPAHAFTTIFTQPPPEAQLWKYGDYRKFAQLFTTQTLYFRRADKLPDIFEGKFTEANKQRRSEMFATTFADLRLSDAEAIRAIQESHRVRTFLNCWHKNTRENPRMWEAYTTSNDSIALVTTVASLGAATRGQCRAAEVHYVGEDEPLPELHSLAALVHKRRDPYAFENEFRLIYTARQEETIRLNCEDDYFRLVSVNTATLLHGVRFHPKASAEFKTKVRLDIAAAKLTAAAAESEFTVTMHPA